MREHVLPVQPTRSGRRRRRRDGRRRRAHVQHLDGGRDRRRVGRRGRREAREPRGVVGVRLGGRARGARIPARAAARADRGVDRHARLRIHVRARAPPCDEACGAGARELGTRTIFNVLGPLTNPAGARAGIFGVYSHELVRTVAEALVALGARRAFVVHGAEGIDELSPAGPNHVCEIVRRRDPRAHDRPA